MEPRYWIEWSINGGKTRHRLPRARTQGAADAAAETVKELFPCAEVWIVPAGRVDV